MRHAARGKRQYLVVGEQTVTEQTLQHAINRQDNGYYCAPASTHVALTVRGIYESEKGLAAQLGMTESPANSVTDVTRVLNEHVGEVYRTWFTSGHAASDADVTTFRTNVVLSVDARFAVVAYVIGVGHDVDGAAYSYNGGHTVAVAGYRRSGNEALITDVAIGRDYWMTTKALVTWIADRGYTYVAEAAAARAVDYVADIPPGAAYPLPAGHYYGDINGPESSHGGYYANETPVVKTIQQKLIAAGCVPGITDVHSDWVDGKFETPTIDAVKQYQGTHALVQDGRVGPVTWSSLFPVT